MSNSLLPRHATATERAIEASTARAAALPVPLRELHDPDTCPAELLPWLAWAWGVDKWAGDWPADIKRAAIKAAYEVHARKGSAAAVRRALDAMRLTAHIKEWYEHGGAPNTFRVDAYADENISGGEAILSPQMYAAIRRVIDATKPVSRHCTLRVGARFDDALRAASAGQVAGLGQWTAQPKAVQPPPAATALRAASAARTTSMIRTRVVI
ncbi:MAG: phage tail protein I [Thiohalomonadaceae bacterium]